MGRDHVQCTRRMGFPQVWRKRLGWCDSRCELHGTYGISPGVLRVPQEGGGQDARGRACGAHQLSKGRMLPPAPEGRHLACTSGWSYLPRSSPPSARGSTSTRARSPSCTPPCTRVSPPFCSWKRAQGAGLRQSSTAFPTHLDVRGDIVRGPLPPLGPSGACVLLYSGIQSL